LVDIGGAWDRQRHRNEIEIAHKMAMARRCSVGKKPTQEKHKKKSRTLSHPA
jgi:hypothetical protein